MKQLLLISIICAFISSCGNSEESTSAAKLVNKKIYTTYREAQSNNNSFLVNILEYTDNYQVGKRRVTTSDDKKIIAVKIHVVNANDDLDDVIIPPSCFQLQSSDGKIYTNDGATAIIDETFDTFEGDLYKESSGHIYFRVPSDVKIEGCKLLVVEENSKSKLNTLPLKEESMPSTSEADLTPNKSVLQYDSFDNILEIQIDGATANVEPSEPNTYGAHEKLLKVQLTFTNTSRNDIFLTNSTFKLETKWLQRGIYDTSQDDSFSSATIQPGETIDATLYFPYYLGDSNFKLIVDDQEVNLN